jgi:drug/metabolite transporter (DMT)-like permease
MFWSTAASAFKLTLAFLPAAQLLLFAALTSFLCLGIYVLLTRRYREFYHWRLKDLTRSAGLGFLNPFLYYLVLFQAYTRLPAQEAQPLNFLWPIVLVLMSGLVERRRISASSVLCMVISFCGVIIIATRGEPLSFRLTDPLGVSLALASTVIWSAYWVFNSVDGRDPVNRLFVNFAFGLVWLSAYLLIDGGFARPSLAGLAGAAYIGVFEMGITFVLWLYALKFARSTADVGSLIYLTPFLSVFLVWLLVGEQIYSSTVIGLLMIVGGIVLHHTTASSTPSNEQTPDAS